MLENELEQRVNDVLHLLLNRIEQPERKQKVRVLIARDCA